MEFDVESHSVAPGISPSRASSPDRPLTSVTRKCPKCGSVRVRRSSARPGRNSGRRLYRSPYRCRDCGTRFWAISHRAIATAAVVVTFAIVLGIVWVVSGGQEGSSAVARTDSKVAVPPAEMLDRARRGDPVAEMALYRIYAEADEIANHERQARSWLYRAAEHGVAEAQHELAVMLRQGRGVVQDYARAAQWMQRAAEKGHAQSQYELGLMYRSGVGVAADPAKAYIWLSLAAAQGFPGADAVRDSMLGRLSAEEVSAAQKEARRMSERDLEGAGN